VENSGLAAASSGPAQEGLPAPGAVRSRWWRSFPWTPPRVVLVYAAVGLLWIAFSDRALQALIPDAGMRDWLQTAKGSFYVLATSALIFELVRRGQRRLLSFGTEIRSAVESMADGVLVLDTTGIVEANPAAVELLGASAKQDVLGDLDSFVRRFLPRATDGTPLTTADLATVVALRGAHAVRDTVLRRLDGRDIVVNVSASPVATADAPLTISVLRDVSRAHRLETMREEFLATAAHELKTPLAVVKAYAQLVQRRVPAEAPALAVVQRQVDRMTRLVQHLLDASRLRLDPGAAGPREPFDLSLLVSEVIDRVRAAEPGIQLRLLAPGPVSVRADRERIARVVHSLLDNAVRFSPGGGAIEARVAREGDLAEVSVTDHGLGIPVERQERIFERYYRAHAGTPEDYGGLGLSLDMSREIVTRHGGRIWFESTPGQGSTFHFSLPAGREGT
jgi:two-component system phosphate regulon sensor histidine kinase PhoR